MKWITKRCLPRWT